MSYFSGIKIHYYQMSALFYTRLKKIPAFRGLLLLVSLSFLALPVSTSAAEEEEGSEADTIESHGLALYQQELYDEAVLAFRQLLEIRPNQQVYFNIGQCEFMRKRFDLALEAFTIYLAGDREKIAPKRREYTEKVVKEITPRVGRLDIQGGSPLEVWIDDEFRGNTPLDRQLFVLDGEHRLAFKRNGEIVQNETYAVAVGQTITIQAPDIAPEPESEPVPEVKPEDEAPDEPVMETSDVSANEEANQMPPEPKKSPLKTVGIVIASLGGVALASGIVTGSLALSKDKEFTDRCPNKDKLCPESNENLANRTMALGTAMNVLLPIGAVAVITGVTLAIVGHKKNSKQRESKDTGSLHVVPFSTRSQAGILIEGSF